MAFKRPAEKDVFSLKVPIKDSGRSLYTYYPFNNLRVLQVNPGGNVEMWEIALVTQRGQLFLTTQKPYSFFCYNNEGKIVCPEINWPQLEEALNRIISPEDVLPVKDYFPLDREIEEDFAPREGRVIWYNFAQQLGAIKTRRGVARVHWSEVMRPEFRYLAANELVLFRSLTRPRQFYRPTSFKLEARKVRPL